MSDVHSKLDALGGILDVQDDTREIERPAQLRRPIGEILRGHQHDTGHITGTPPPEMDTPPGLVSLTPAARAPLRPRTRTSRDSGPSPRVEQTAASSRRERGQRSSANLPMELVERLMSAKHRRRWELSQLVAGALDNVDVDAAPADDLLERVWHEPRVQRAYQLAASDVDRLDKLGERWRMNRSQVLAVILPLELDRLGL